MESNDSFIAELYIENLSEEKLLEKYKSEKFLKKINSGWKIKNKVFSLQLKKFLYQLSKYGNFTREDWI